MDILFVILCVAIFYHIISQGIRERAREILLARISATLYEIEEINKSTNGYLDDATSDLRRVTKFIDKLEKDERDRFWGTDTD